MGYIIIGYRQYTGSYLVVFQRFTVVAQEAFVPVGYTPPCPSFQPWENHAWWWLQFKEPPN